MKRGGGKDPIQKTSHDHFQEKGKWTVKRGKGVRKGKKESILTAPGKR